MASGTTGTGPYGIVANADLSASQFLLLKTVDGGTDAYVDLQTSAGARVEGVLLNKPTAGQAATVQVHGIVKVVAGGTFAAGARLAANGSAKAVVSNGTTDKEFGTALEDGVANQLVRVLLSR